MKIETHILFIEGDRIGAERIEGSVFGSMKEVKQQLANDGVDLIGNYELHEFTEAWNETELHYELDTYFISYIYITK